MENPMQFIGRAFLLRSPASDAVPYYENLLATEDPIVLTEILKTLGDNNSANWWYRVETDEDAIKLFDALGPTLVEFTKRDDLTIMDERSLANTLSFINPTPARDWVLSHFVNSIKNNNTDCTAYFALRRIGAVEAVPLLSKILEKDTRVVNEVIRTLIEILDDEESLPILHAALSVNPSEDYRESIRKTIEHLEAGSDPIPYLTGARSD
jgi:hypothetical protein